MFHDNCLFLFIIYAVDILSNALRGGMFRLRLVFLPDNAVSSGLTAAFGFRALPSIVAPCPGSVERPGKIQQFQGLGLARTAKETRAFLAARRFEFARSMAEWSRYSARSLAPCFSEAGRDRRNGWQLHWHQVNRRSGAFKRTCKTDGRCVIQEKYACVADAELRDPGRPVP